MSRGEVVLWPGVQDDMIYFKSVVAGLVAALGVVVLSVLLVWISADAWLRFQMWRQQRQGSGGLGAVSVGVSDTVVILLALAGFAAGFWWEFRRASRQGTHRRRRRTWDSSGT